MNTATAEMKTSDSVMAPMNYTIDDGVKPVNETFGPANIYGRSTGTTDQQMVRVRNARPLAAQLSLDTHGFRLARHLAGLKNILDAGELKAIYYPEMERLVCEISGAVRAVMFNHTIRHGDQAVRESIEARMFAFFA